MIIPRIQKSDTYKFTKRDTVAYSSAISIWNPGGTLITSLQVASYSSINSQYEAFYTDPGSYHTTVESSGFHIIEWTLYRNTGNDKEKEYFEIIEVS